ncbi:MAG TPA: CHASE domain-containing protein [Gallionellaceae bacterium]|nr:CHASE domain-containing protein [Gallionellaceae bacterium]
MIAHNTPAMPETARGRVFIDYLPWLVLLASLSMTAIFWEIVHRSSLQEQRIAFDALVGDLDDRIQRRMVYYDQVLHAVRGFYLNQRVMEPEEFAGYVASLEIGRNFPGIQGISFAPLVADQRKASHVASIRKSGMSGYTIQPSGQRAYYAPVTLIEPRNERNLRVLGFDNLSDVIRRNTLERARDAGTHALSEKLVLRQEGGLSQEAGFLLFLPVYQHNKPHDTLVQRQANIEGWFAASFRMADFMTALLDGHDEGINIEVFDGGVQSEQARMYGRPRPAALLAASETFDIAGRSWRVNYSSLPEFETKRDVADELAALLAGLALSLLLTLVSWLLMRDRRRTEQTTRAISRELEMRRQAESRTNELYLFNEAILEKSPAGIAVYKASGPCVMVNAAYARAIGGTVEEVRKQNFRSNASWQRNGLLDFANQAFETGLTLRRDIFGETSFGKKVAVECIFAPINITGQAHLLVIVNDVSDRAAAENALTASMRQLEEKELAKTRFLAAAGHDLRQPMAAANLFIDALKLTETSARQQEIIQRLDQSMATFNGLLDALLNVSRLDAGMIKPQYSAVNVSEIFNWLEQNFAPTANDRKLSFRLYFPLKEALIVRSDLGLLQSVLMNLVTNAIKFTAKGAVLVSARARGNEVLFQVWDTGMGIAPEHVERIFDEFYQVDNPQRDRSSGLGLGLAIVRRALTLLGAEVSCRSQPGRGSVFEFRLPQAASEGMSSSTPARPKEVANEAFARGMRFILVEDDVLVSQAMLNWLEGMGAEVKCFHSAEDALHHASIDYADYFIVDYMLGGTLNGIQFLNKVRQKVGRPIQAVVVTGDTSSAFIRHAVECDWPVLHKPINTSQLIAHLVGQEQGRQL